MDLTYNAPTEDREDIPLTLDGWFLYWKSSASLWESKLKAHKARTPLFVPIYWGFHSETGETYDFGSSRPETNLKKLSQLAASLGKEIFFLFPMGPLPFLPNGGLPHFLSRNPSMSAKGLPFAVADAEGNINKLYSFFDPRVYKAFRKFSVVLANYLTQEGIGVDVLGLRPFFFEGGQFRSYLEDRGKAFELSFAKYISINRNAQKISHSTFNSESEELESREKYIHEMQELYYTTAEEALYPNWIGSLPFYFFDGAPKDIFLKVAPDLDSSRKLCFEFLEVLRWDFVASGLLLSAEAKEGFFGQLARSAFGSHLVDFFLQRECFDDDFTLSYEPLRFFRLHEGDPRYCVGPSLWEELGVLNVLQERLQYPYAHKLSGHQLTGLEESKEPVHLISGLFVNQKNLSLIFRALMSAKKIILDTTGLDLELRRKLEIFYAENNIQIQNLNYHTQVTHAKLGEGVLVSFEAERLLNLDLNKREQFWERLFSSFELPHLHLDNARELFWFWHYRSPSPTELDFQEVRRVVVYNPTSYKKKAKFLSAKNFVLMKILDSENVQVESTPQGTELILHPKGSVLLDYGFFE